MTLNGQQVATLIKMAEELDEDGNQELAQTLDSIAYKFVAAAEKEEKEESSGFALSGKQKAAIRALQKAAERCDKVFGNKIPKSCRKISNLVDDMLDECSKCELD